MCFAVSGWFARRLVRRLSSSWLLRNTRSGFVWLSWSSQCLGSSWLSLVRCGRGMAGWANLVYSRRMISVDQIKRDIRDARFPIKKSQPAAVIITIASEQFRESERTGTKATRGRRLRRPAHHTMLESAVMTSEKHGLFWFQLSVRLSNLPDMLRLELGNNNYFRAA